MAIEPERLDFRRLLIANPNHFGNLTDSTLKPVKPMTGNTTYEELTCVGFNPDTNLLEGHVQIKRDAGYEGDLCHPGSQEYVRFFVDYGGGWVDAGVVSFDTHDIPIAPDCAKQPNRPLSYVVTLHLDPNINKCDKPMLPRVRGILSWQWDPPAGTANANWLPPWGNRLDDHIQVKPFEWLHFPILGLESHIKLLDPAILAQITPLTQPNPPPMPDPPPLALAELVKAYAGTSAKPTVEAHRFGMTDIQGTLDASKLHPELVQAKVVEWKQIGLDWQAILAALQKVQADVNYEELECLGLDTNLERLVATLHIKRPAGYLGDLCHRGSREYVAFWADLDNTCKWTYLGTTSVAVHDFSTIPADGLRYSVTMPVNLATHRRTCSQPKIARIRAVLSWNVAPSTTNPDALTHYGNRQDTHVLIPPGPPVTGPTPLIWKMGGINIHDIYDSGALRGQTMPTARFNNGALADAYERSCPFGGRVVITGWPFPGNSYRVQVKKETDLLWTTVQTPMLLESLFGVWYTKNPINANGFFSYETVTQNPEMTLAWWDTPGGLDALWQVKLEVGDAAGNPLPVPPLTLPIMLDNTAPRVRFPFDAPLPYDVDIQITGGNCGKYTPGAIINGTFVARDTFFGGWSFQVLPNNLPGGTGTLTSNVVGLPANPPNLPLPVPASGNQTNPAPGGNIWSLDTTNMTPCGYVVLLDVADRAILNSVPQNHDVYTSVGFCLDAPLPPK